ncbi:glycosyltransferase [Mesorhizobium sp. MSK_1335]|uniref:Glycosyltransferase n=1 Tax=Mesorhizobium montanum TaxID=3072323 RepID=A0ABU4ZU88_9HYPH|nr:glycosyltransferase [Mesorhizobium sp. MSK_1335]MDX8528976.1 glycosyltransferase [Mesorhizobium sp. MSK_1335]
MKIAFYGSSLLSSYWNGAATYYRGLLKALSRRGYHIVFYEPDAFDRQKHRDIEAPDWCNVVVYEATPDALMQAASHAAQADIVVKASGVGFEDDALLRAVLDHARAGALTVFWDVDAPATLSDLRNNPDHPTHEALKRIGLVLTYGGGDPVVRDYRTLGAAECMPIYNALDPETHHPVALEPRFACDLAFLGNRLPDREARVDSYFLEPARLLADQRFLLGGSGWADKLLPENVSWLGHVGTRDHNAFNVTPKAVLNISRDSMASNGFSPATRVFEAAGAGACIVTDPWAGIEMFLTPGEEILVARDGADVADIMRTLEPRRAKAIGAAARRRVLAEHTYTLRAELVDAIFKAHFERLTVEAAE